MFACHFTANCLDCICQLNEQNVLWLLSKQFSFVATKQAKSSVWVKCTSRSTAKDSFKPYYISVQQVHFSVNDAFLNIYLIDSLQGKTWTVVSDDEGGYNVTLPLGFGMYGQHLMALWDLLTFAITKAEVKTRDLNGKRSGEQLILTRGIFFISRKIRLSRAFHKEANICSIFPGLLLLLRNSG